ncbi:MAG: NUDIX domain-containing protein [Candidatus Saccharimonas sp.]
MSDKKPGVGVGVMVVNGQKVLLGLRNSNRIKASSELRGEGTWTMPGGKVDFGERLDDAARRELKEETGLAGDIPLELITVVDDIIGEAHYVTFGFKTELPAGQEPNVCEPEAIVEWRWFDLNNLPSNLYSASANLLRQYNKNVVYGENKKA